MSPSGVDDYDDADLPGLDEIDNPPDPRPSGEPSRGGDYDDADLPGLDEIDNPPDPRPSGEPAPTQEPEWQWTNEELDDWFENDFGGHEAFVEKIVDPFDVLEHLDRFGVEPVLPHVPERLRPSIRAYAEQFDFGTTMPWGFRVRGGGGRDLWARPRRPLHLGVWRNLSHEMKEQFRAGINPDPVVDAGINPDPVVDELAPLEPPEHLPLLEADQVVDEPADGGPTSPAPGSFRWLMIAAGAALVGLLLAAAFLLVDDSDEPEEAATTVATASEATAAITAEAEEAAATASGTTATITVETAPDANANQPEASDSPDRPVESPSPGTTYTATKIADLVIDGDVRVLAPIGTSYESTLLVDEACFGDICSYESIFDMEFAGFADLEWGERVPATWDVDGPSWSVEMSARYAYLDDAELGTCVVLVQERWEVIVTETRPLDDGSTAATFTGTMTRGDSLDRSVSTDGVDVIGLPVCPFVGSVVDEWSVVGIAVIRPDQTP